MGMGAREGGFALAVGGLSLAGAYGVYTGLIVRLRELVWTAVGLLLIKLGNKPALVFLKLMWLKLCPTGIFYVILSTIAFWEKI